jgi:transposase
MAERVKVRRLSDEEGRQLQRIVRRGEGRSEKSIVKWRRAMVVLASAGSNDVAVIARLVQTSPDRVREMIHRFNEVGMESLDPRWAGGRPRLITTIDRELIVKTAKKRPRSLGQPFTQWSIRKLRDYLGSKKGRRVVISRERLRPDPRRGADHLPADQDLEGVNPRSWCSRSERAFWRGSRIRRRRGSTLLCAHALPVAAGSNGILKLGPAMRFGDRGHRPRRPAQLDSREQPDA